MNTAASLKQKLAAAAASARHPISASRVARFDRRGVPVLRALGEQPDGSFEGMAFGPDGVARRVCIPAREA